MNRPDCLLLICELDYGKCTVGLMYLLIETPFAPSALAPYLWLQAYAQAILSLCQQVSTMIHLGNVAFTNVVQTQIPSDVSTFAVVNVVDVHRIQQKLINTM